ncbi:MAG: diphthine synthase [Nanoarchaeota archaeon]|nr:diphthine synthase [Nanoarchaeota archaeon]
MLYIIGLGIAFDLTEKSKKIINKSKVYVECYTSWLPSEKELRGIVGKDFSYADRKLMEDGGDGLVEEAKKEDIAILVPGDPLSATTHIDLLQRAKKADVKTEVIHNSSILTVVARTGLQLYKFGKTASIPFPQPSHRPDTPYKIYLENQKMKAHTLFLLDMVPAEDKYMTPAEAVNYLMELGLPSDTLCISCSRLGMDQEEIVMAKASALAQRKSGRPPFCLIIPSGLHFMEEEVLDAFRA